MFPRVPSFIFASSLGLLAGCNASFFTLSPKPVPSTGTTDPGRSDRDGGDAAGEAPDDSNPRPSGSLVASPLSLSSVPEDSGERLVTLPNMGDARAIACGLDSLVGLSVSTACACDGAGVCRVGVTPLPDFEGAASFRYRLSGGDGVDPSLAVVDFDVDGVRDLRMAAPTDISVTSRFAYDLLGTCDAEGVGVVATLEHASSDPNVESSVTASAPCTDGAFALRFHDAWKILDGNATLSVAYQDDDANPLDSTTIAKNSGCTGIACTTEVLNDGTAYESEHDYGNFTSPNGRFLVFTSRQTRHALPHSLVIGSPTPQGVVFLRDKLLAVTFRLPIRPAFGLFPIASGGSNYFRVDDTGTRVGYHAATSMSESYGTTSGWTDTDGDGFMEWIAEECLDVGESGCTYWRDVQGDGRISESTDNFVVLDDVSYNIQTAWRVYDRVRNVGVDVTAFDANSNNSDWYERAGMGVLVSADLLRWVSYTQTQGGDASTPPNGEHVVARHALTPTGGGFSTTTTMAEIRNEPFPATSSESGFKINGSLQWHPDETSFRVRWSIQPSPYRGDSENSPVCNRDRSVCTSTPFANRFEDTHYAFSPAVAPFTAPTASGRATPVMLTEYYDGEEYRCWENVVLPYVGNATGCHIYGMQNPTAHEAGVWTADTHLTSACVCAAGVCTATVNWGPGQMASGDETLLFYQVFNARAGGTDYSNLASVALQCDQP